jgi:predicted RND superfamily exporter protein
MDAALPPIGPTALAALAGAALLLAFGWVCLRPASVVRHPAAVLGMVALLTLVSLLVLVRLDPPGLRLSIDPSGEPLLPADDPEQDVYREAVRDFGDDEVYVIAMEADDVFSAAQLGRLRRISDAIEHLPGVRHVQSLVDVTSFRWVPEQEWIEVRPLIETVPTAPAALAELRSRALSNPLYLRTVVSEDGRTAALNVSFRKMTDKEFISAGIDASISQILAGETVPGVRFHVAGRPHVKTHVYQTMLADLRLLVPLAIFAMAAVLAIATGSFRSVLLPLGSVLIAVIWTFAAVALLQRPLTVLTTLLGPNLIVVGSVYGVHVLARFGEEAAEHHDPRIAGERTLEHMLLPVLIAGITTLIGYGSLMITNVPAVFEYGTFCVYGLAASTLLSLTFVPAISVLLPLPRQAAATAREGARRRPRLTDRVEAAVDRLLERLSQRSQRHASGAIAFWSLLSVASLVVIPRVAIDTDYLSFFDANAPVRRDFESVNRLLAGAVPLYVVVDGGAPGAFREPSALRSLEAVETQMATLPGVTHTVSMVDTLRVLNRVMEEDDPAAEHLPDSRSAVAELLNLVPKGELSRLATTNQERVNLVVRTGEVGSAAVRRLVVALEDVLAKAGLAPGMSAHVTGNAILVSRSSDAIAWGQANSVFLAALTILVLLTVMLRSLKLGLIAMAPNVIPVVLFFGLLGAGVATLSLPTSLIASVALGISIDDTVHYLVRYRSERERGAEPEEAIRITSIQIGRPMSTAALMLILGFLVVGLSGFATLRQFGLLSAGTMAICLATDLILLPALLIRTRA